MLNRREALGAVIGAAVSFVLPVPRKRLDLLAFCGRRDDSRKYDVTLPWEYDDFTFATDGRACVRVRPESGDRRHHDGEMPPFGDLPWDHARLRGWRQLPHLEPLLADQSACPACKGSGFRGGVVGNDCPTCDGMGREWAGGSLELSVPVKCRPCNGKGFIPPPGVPACPACEGNAVGVFPSVVRLGGGHYFDAALYERVRALGGEYVVGQYGKMPVRDGALLSFRFDGGAGLLLGLNRAGVERRLVKGG